MATMRIPSNLLGSRSVIILYAWVLLHHIVECVVASEWSIAGPADEYVMAVMNITYTDPSTGQQKHPEFGGEVRNFSYLKFNWGWNVLS